VWQFLLSSLPVTVKEDGDLVPFTTACRRARKKQLFTGGSALIDLAKHVLEPLRKDQGSILYRGRKEEDSSQVLVLAPTKEEPESLKRLENEYSLREELDRLRIEPRQLKAEPPN
jgi:hypothetical protein